MHLGQILACKFRRVKSKSCVKRNVPTEECDEGSTRTNPGFVQGRRVIALANKERKKRGSSQPRKRQEEELHSRKGGSKKKPPLSPPPPPSPGDGEKVGTLVTPVGRNSAPPLSVQDEEAFPPHPEPQDPSTSKRGGKGSGVAPGQKESPRVRMLLWATGINAAVVVRAKKAVLVSKAVQGGGV